MGRPRGRRSRNTRLDEVDIERTLELLAKAKAKGWLDEPENAHHVEQLKEIARSATGDRWWFLRLLKVVKSEVYEFAGTVIAKMLKE